MISLWACGVGPSVQFWAQDKGLYFFFFQAEILLGAMLALNYKRIDLD